MLKRREFVKNLSMASLAMTLPLRSWAQGSLSTTALGNNIHLISGAGCNVVVAVGSDSVVVVDGGLRANNEALLQEINSISGGKPISTLFNTNWRPEHVGLNYLLGGTDTKIVAHENTRLWQGADFFVEWENKHFIAMPEESRAKQTFYKKGSLDFGSETIEYGYLPQAHTDGDIYVYFTQANLLVVSNLMGAGSYPILDYVTGGWIGGMQDASAALLAIADDNSRLIAANGTVQSMADLKAQSEMLTLARDKVGDSFRSGWSLEEFKASAPEAEFGAQWGDADLFLTQVYRGTWYHVPGRAVRNVV